MNTEPAQTPRDEILEGDVDDAQRGRPTLKAELVRQQLEDTSMAAKNVLNTWQGAVKKGTNEKF